MHLSDRQSLWTSRPCARARAKNPHIFKKKAEEKKEEKRLHAPFIARTLTVVDRTLEDLVDRTAEEEPIMVDRACAEENIFFSLCCRTQKKEARVENMMLFFFEREFEVFFFPKPEGRDERERERRERREKRALFRTKRLSRPKKRPHVLFFVSAFFHERERRCAFDLCLFFWHTPIEKFKKKYITLLSFIHTSLHKQTDARARLQPRTTTINKRSLCFWGNRRRRTLSTHTENRIE